MKKTPDLRALAKHIGAELGPEFAFVLCVGALPPHEGVVSAGTGSAALQKMLVSHVARSFADGSVILNMTVEVPKG